MIRKIAKILAVVMCFICLCTSISINPVQAAVYEGDYGVIDLPSVPGSSSGSGTEYIKLKNTGLRIVLEYTEGKQTVKNRSEVGGSNSEKYYLNFVKSHKVDSKNKYTEGKQVKILLGNAIYDSEFVKDKYGNLKETIKTEKITYEAPEKISGVSSHLDYLNELVNTEIATNELELYDFKTDTIVINNIDLNALSKGEKIKCDLISQNEKKDYGQFFVDWKNASPDRLYVTDSGIKLIASILAARAYNEQDFDTVEELREIYNWSFEQIFVRAEILYDVDVYVSASKSYKDRIPDWSTYREIRECVYNNCLEANSLRTGGYDGGWNYGGFLDFIACKLYEDDERFTIVNGHVNCSCNFLDDAGYEIEYDPNDLDRPLWLRKEGSETRLKTKKEKMPALENTKIVYQPEWANIHIPNACSIEIEGIPGYTTLLNFSGIYRYHENGSSYTSASCTPRIFPVMVHAKSKNDPIEKILMEHIYDYKPTIFEGWDYIEIENSGKVRINSILVTENNEYKLLESVEDTGLRYNQTKEYERKRIEEENVYGNIDYIAHSVVEGIQSTASEMGNLFGDIAKVTLTEDKNEYTVNFFYGEKIGRVRVQEILIVGEDSYEVISESELKTIKYGETLESETIYNDPTKQYVGVCIEAAPNCISTIDYYNLKNYDDESYGHPYGYYYYVEELVNSQYPIYDRERTKVSVSPTATQKDFVVTFIYKREFIDLGVPFNSLHYNNTDEEIIGYDATYDDINDFIQEIFYGTSVDQEQLQTMYNEIVTRVDLTLEQKVNEIFELIEEKGSYIWNNGDTLPMKSLHPAYFTEFQYVADIPNNENITTPNRMGVLDDSSITKGKINGLNTVGGVQLPNGQYIPSLQDIVIASENLGEITGEGKSINIVFLYEKPENKVIEIHKDELTNEIIQTTEHQVIPGESLTLNRLSDPTYEYMGYEQDEGARITDESITLLNVSVDTTVVFWYRKNPDITPKIDPDPENFQEVNPTNPSQPSYDDQKIVLDDDFTITVNYENVLSGSDVYAVFPFDVYYNDGFKAKGNEIHLGKVPESNPVTYNTSSFSATFRLPSWVIEKDYENGVKAYIVTNGDTVVTKYVDIRVIGRLYDFTITNLENDTAWNTSLFKGQNLNTEYKASASPIGQIGSQNPVYPYGIKLGSSFLYSINTKGLKSDNIKIDTEVVYVTADGELVEDAELYYLVAGLGEQKFEAAKDLIPNGFTTALNKPTRATAEVREEIAKGLEFQKKGEYIVNALKSAYASVKNAYMNFAPTTTRQFGNFNTMTLANTLRVPYVRYFDNEVPSLYTNYNINDVGMTKDEILNSVGHWYGEYRLPGTLYAKDSAGNKLPENGYFIILFNIVTLDKDGKPYLSYSLPTTNSQWMKENSNYTSNKIEVLLPRIVGQTSEEKITLEMKNYGNGIDLTGYYPVTVFEASANKNEEVTITH